MFSTLGSDIRQALRVARRQPFFTAIVVGTLALGIGANTAIFGIVEALLVRPLPFPNPERLVTVATPMRGVGVGNAGLSYPELDDLSSRSGVFEDVTPVWAFDTNLTGGGRPERVAALAVSPNYFTMLGVRARMGRVFGPEDTAAGFAEGAILSDAAWRQRFGGDPKILGRRLRFDNDAYTIVGVLPPEFRHPGQATTGDIEVWVTAGFRAAPFPDPPVRAARQLPRTIGRLKAGLTLAQAQSALDAFGGSLRKAFPNDYPERAGWSLRLTPLAEELTGDVKVLLLVILGAVACVLLTCCVSIANMMLAKATGRYREFAVRRALGALPRAIVRQVLTECVVLSGVGGAIGLALVLPLQRVLLTLAPVNLPRLTEVGLNTRMLLFVAVVSLVAGVFVGLVPARGIIGSDLTPHLKDGSQGSGRSRAAGRLRATLVASEIALSLTLMIGAGLLFRSFANVVGVDPGFDPNRLTVANLWLPAPNDPRTAPYPDQQARNVFVREVLRRVRAMPGVESAAMGGGQSIPLVGSNTATFRIEGRAAAQDGELPTAQATGVTPDFFRALGARHVAGRAFQENDDGPNRVVVIDDTMARKYWKGDDPVGRRIAFGQGGQPRWMEIVGVVGTMKTNAFEAPDTPHIYLCMYQGAGNAMSLFVRTVASAAVSGELLRREIEAVDPNLPVFRVRPMAEVVAQSLARRRFALTLVGAFAATALLLAGLGIYGVTAYSVGQRSQEIGLRMAIGAGRRDILQLIVGQGLRIITAGIALGLIGAALLTRLLTSLLFGATPTDPVTYVVVSSVLAVVALLACYVPATRALRIDPVVALRAE